MLFGPFILKLTFSLGWFYFQLFELRFVCRGLSSKSRKLAVDVANFRFIQSNFLFEFQWDSVQLCMKVLIFSSQREDIILKFSRNNNLWRSVLKFINVLFSCYKVFSQLFRKVVKSVDFFKQNDYSELEFGQFECWLLSFMGLNLWEKFLESFVFWS